MIRSRALRAAAPIALAVLLIAGAVAIGRAGIVTQGSAAADCTVDPALDSEELFLLQLINDHRAQNGLAPLSASWTLSKAAQWKSQDMATNRYFAHDDLTRTWVQRIRDCGYGYNAWLGENIAAGNSGALATFNQWKNSTGHNANMLNANYTAIGIGRAYGAGSPYGWYWTNDFGSVADGWPAGTPAPTNTAPPATSTPTRTATPVPATNTATPDRHTRAGDSHPATSDWRQRPHRRHRRRDVRHAQVARAGGRLGARCSRAAGRRRDRQGQVVRPEVRVVRHDRLRRVHDALTAVLVVRHVGELHRDRCHVTGGRVCAGAEPRPGRIEQRHDDHDHPLTRDCRWTKGRGAPLLSACEFRSPTMSWAHPQRRYDRRHE